MRVLDVKVDLGAGATPNQLESFVRGVRVAVDVARDAELRRIRRTAAERMRFPTNDELRAATERLPRIEGGLADRARRLLEIRRDFAEAPRELWWDYWYAGPTSELFTRLRGTGYERLLAATSVSWPAVLSAGLDVLDPELYETLVANQLTRLTPELVVVHRMQYLNPAGIGLAAVEEGIGILDKTAGLVETTATLPFRLGMARAQARVAKRTVDDHVEASHLQVELLREQLRAARLSNDITEQRRIQEAIRTAQMDEELKALKIKNAQEFAALPTEQQQRLLHEHLLANGLADEADAVRALPPPEAASLVELASRNPEFEMVDEVD